MDKATRTKIDRLRKLHYPSAREQEYIQRAIGAEGLKAVLAGRQPTTSSKSETLSGLWDYDYAMSDNASGEKGIATREKRHQNPRVQRIQTLGKAVLEARREGVKISLNDLIEAYKYIGGQSVDSQAGNVDFTRQIENSTPIIEDQTERLQAYVTALAVKPGIDALMRELLGVDVVEDIYREAFLYMNNPGMFNKARKALDNAETAALESQRLEAVGMQWYIVEALGTVLHGRYSDFIQNLMDSLYWSTPIKTVRNGGI